MRYEFDEELQKKAEEISLILFPHVDIVRIKCFRSYGTSSKRTIARCHALGKLMQKAIGIKAVYALEFLSERFDKFDEEEQIKIIIHELMHIPKTFGGGFKHHDVVTEKNVNLMYDEFKKRKSEDEKKKDDDSLGIMELEKKNKENKKLLEWFRRG